MQGATEIDEVEMLAEVSAAERLLESITERQREVLDRVVEHRTSKEIARELGISPNTVDQRINAVRRRLGASDRAEVARLYAELIRVCGKTTYGSSVVEKLAIGELGDPRDAEIKPVFFLSDSVAEPRSGWESVGELVIPRAGYAEGKLWRLGMIVAIALGVLALGTISLAVMQSLSAVLR